MFRFLPAVALLCLSRAVAAAGPAAALMPPVCDPAIVAAETALRLPRGLLGAIARVESGRLDPAGGPLQPWPWTINAEGEGAFFATKAEAIAAVRSLQARGVRSIDVGCMQVNLMYHPAAFASLEEAFDPRTNAMVAARFLGSLHAAAGDWLAAAGTYHSQTEALGAPYRRRVLTFWRDPSADWHWGLAVAYRDFAPHSRVYADFAPRETVYGAFAASRDGGRVP